MNKNSKQRRAIALRNFHVDGQASTEFDVPVMRPGGYTLTKTSVRIGFVQPPPNKRRQRTQAAVIDSAANAANAEVAALAAAADALLGKPKAEQPLKERPAPRPVRPAKPLGRINI